MPSRRHVLGVVGSAFAGCTMPAFSVPTLDDQPCPPIETHAHRSVCSHTDSTGGIQITASPTTFSTDRESLESMSITIENGADESFVYDPFNWRVYRNAGWGWTEREKPTPSRSDTSTIRPGKSANWSGVDALWKIGAAGPTPAGLYAAVTTVSVGEEVIACVALFHVAKK